MSYHVTIRPRQRWLHLPFKEVAEYRDLLVLLVRRDFVAKYKQTVLGPLWFVIQPLLTTLVFTVIFGAVAKIPTDGLPPVLFYLCGLLGWNYFAQTFNATSNTFLTNAHVFGKVYFPRLIVPLSATISNLLALGLNLVIFAGFFAYFEFFTPAGGQLSLGWDLLSLPLVVLQVAAVGLGTGLLVSALTAKFRDLTHLSAFIIQLWLYATPVIYPLSQVPEKWRPLVALNPMAIPVELIKGIFLGQGVATPGLVAMSAALSAVILLLGLFLFQRTERTFIDTV